MPTIDQYSVSTVPVEMFFNETFLSLGTGFVWESSGQIFLITNWHNVSGRNPNTGAHLSTTLAEPNKLRVWWNVRNQLGNKQAVEHNLLDDEGRPLWFVHPDHQQGVDAVALPVLLPDIIEPYPITAMEQRDLEIQIGMDVFVLGYPFGITQGGLPVWKRGSIATEPQLANTGNQRHLLLDTASRPGMSGSPVIRKAWGSYMLTDGSVAMGHGSATKLVGIYSGRLAANDPLDAQLGIMWPAVLLNEIVSGGVRDEPR
ncbi:hypothetical protein GFK91_07060 [Roseibium aggregatum]|uniref:S1 family peptidase n=1 Tax=Roseibium aggregatum TaxID=187304 RepID=UPI001E3770A0|nr:serine protease [Roseibium aggregatum]UES55387.1 hypothetical protein GFK91_07060 [Roseibium aggregatum]